MSAFSGRIWDLSVLIVSPAVEKTLLLGVEEAWTHKYDRAMSDYKGYTSLFLHHQAEGSSEVKAGGRALYIASSFSALILMAGAAAATLLIMFNFRTSSAAKSFSRAVSFIFLLVWSLKERKNISNSKNIQSLIFFYKIWLKECLMFIKVYWYRPGHMTIHERRRKCTHWNSLILRCLALLLSSWLVSLLASHLVLARDTRLCQLQQVSVIRQTQTNE